ncbi:putative metal-nicotianamine transporter YSL6 [Hibiscus syriacus]|uniref:Metal-nicotianamine transporter YSL6 n=1 Tax=Hibiscus syriacus TaxID=106335 RepID=A0A6A2ZX55_HIBSY|nr:putative metal-nicotianamine transporter YSL6 [Hibiscus syriacus]
MGIDISEPLILETEIFDAGAESERVPEWKDHITIRGLVVSALLGTLFCIITHKMNLTAGMFPTLNVGAELLGYFFVKSWTGFLSKFGFRVSPFTKQENTVIQTCVVACYGLAFNGGFGSYLIAMDERTYNRIGVDYPGNRAEDVKNPGIGWMMGFLFAVSFLGLFSVAPLRRFGSYLIAMDQRTYNLISVDYPGNRAEDVKKPGIGWMIGFLFVVSFLGLGFGSCLIAMDERTYNLIGVDYHGNRAEDVKNPGIGWMIGFLFVVSFLGLFSVAPLRKMLRNRGLDGCSVSSLLGFGSCLIAMDERTYNLIGVDYHGNRAEDVKNPRIGWMIGFLFVVSFLGLFSVAPLRGFGLYLIAMDERTYKLISVDYPGNRAKMLRNRGLDGCSVSSLLGFGSCLIAMDERTYNFIGVDYHGNRAEDVKNPGIGWMIGFLFVVSFLGLFSVAPLWGFGSYLIDMDERTYNLIDVDYPGNRAEDVKNLGIGWMIGFLFVVSFLGLFSVASLRKV